jgi:hypothetical protein
VVVMMGGSVLPTAATVLHFMRAQNVGPSLPSATLTVLQFRCPRYGRPVAVVAAASIALSFQTCGSDGPTLSAHSICRTVAAVAVDRTCAYPSYIFGDQADGPTFPVPPDMSDRRSRARGKTRPRPRQRRSYISCTLWGARN